MKKHFELMADYNTWANTRLYRMAAHLPDEAYRRDVGIYFKSLHGTLNHLVTADSIWLRRLTGTGEHPPRLDAIVFADLPALTAARRRADERIIEFVHGLAAEKFDNPCEYQTLAGVAQRQAIREILAHVFNHQTHHRGQAHAALTILGVAEPDPLDLHIMLRERAKH